MDKNKLNKVSHDSIPPIYNKESKILILGSIPSPKSREYGFYYGHPQNRFWKVLADIFDENKTKSISDKKEFLIYHKIALWDVLDSCMINGADDSSIKEPKANDISKIIKNSSIKRIYTTGKKAYDLYMKLCFADTGIEAILLPSTSPANCRIKYEELLDAYKSITNSLNEI